MEKGKPKKDYWFEMYMNGIVNYEKDNGDGGWYEEFIPLFSTKSDNSFGWITIRGYTLNDLLELKKRFNDHVKILRKALDGKIKEMKKVE